VYVVIAVAIVILLRDFVSYGTIFMTECVYYIGFSRYS
jgi:hypothetical protein